MQNMNTRWNKFITGLITNIGWLIVVVLSLLIILFTQLGTNHRNEAPVKYNDLFSVYDEYGRIKWVTILNKISDEEEWWTIEDHYDSARTRQEQIIITETKKLDNAGNLSPVEKKQILDSIARAENSLVTLDVEYKLVEANKIGERGGLNLQTLVLKDIQNMSFDYIAEYRFDKIIKVATTDIFSWILVILIAVSSIVIKIQGNKTGKISAFKLVWRTTSRHATLSEKIAPRSVEAEQICITMNEDELKRQRITRLQRDALSYEDVFNEDGSFLRRPNFIKVDITAITKSNGKTKYVENKYQKKLLKRQEKVVKKLRKFKIKEVHTYILLESKAEARERFDYGESIRTRDKRTTTTNILTSLITALPMFTAASIFVFTGDKASLLLGAAGIVLNLGSLLFNMFGAYDYIINTWTPNLVKKCDTLLSIAIELGLADDIDRNWDSTIEKELIAKNSSN